MRKLCRVLFSRYAISAIMIVFEVLATVYLAINAWGSLYVLAAVAAVYALAAIISLINRDANPEYKTTWAVIIFILPVLGPTLYLLFYQRRMSKKETRLIFGGSEKGTPFGLSPTVPLPVPRQPRSRQRSSHSQPLDITKR